MKVVSNASPLCYLILIEEIQILFELFSEILIPQAVQRELAHPDAPEAVRSWIEGPPQWLAVGKVSPSAEDEELQRLDPGEREAIVLAEQVGSDLLLLDDLQARKIAQRRGLMITGLIGVLKIAVERDLVDPAVVERLRATTFRASPDLLDRFHRDD